MLHWRLTGRAEVSFFASLAGIGPDERPAGVEGALNVMGAHAFSDRRVGACSTGQRRRLMLAAGLVTRAPVLVIDEPYSDLDEAGRGAVAATFRAWADAGGVVLYAAPEEGDGPEPDRAITIVEGRIREQP